MFAKLFYLRDAILNANPQKTWPFLRPLLRFCQDIILTIALFLSNNCPLRATAMTLYSLLSIVPVIALAYGIAQGFGLETMLQNWLQSQFAGQEEILTWLMGFAQTMLSRARGSIIAGVGILLLFWSVYRILWQIEKAFNAIWRLNTPRSPQQRVSDYLFILVVCPLLLMLSSSLMIFVVSNVTSLIDNDSGFSALKIFLPLLRLLPGCVLWLLLYFMYTFMPNTRVQQKASLLGGIIFGTIFSLWQWLYLNSQIALSGYNAIYGSFAALPIFIIWLNFSWMIVLLGAQYVFVRQNNSNKRGLALLPGSSTSHSQTMICALHVVAFCAERFSRNQPAPDLTEIATSLDLHPLTVSALLRRLTKARILVTCAGEKETWQPALPVDHLTIPLVITRLEDQGEGKSELPPAITASRLKTTYLELRLQQEGETIPLHKLLYSPSA